MVESEIDKTFGKEFIMMAIRFFKDVQQNADRQLPVLPASHMGTD